MNKSTFLYATLVYSNVLAIGKPTELHTKLKCAVSVLSLQYCPHLAQLSAPTHCLPGLLRSVAFTGLHSSSTTDIRP